MATEILDLRRTDERNTYLHHPTWIESAPITKEADGKAAILMDFSSLKGRWFFIHEVAVEIVTPFVGGTITLDIGEHTIATVDAVTGDTAALVDNDKYLGNVGITEGAVDCAVAAANVVIQGKAAAIQCLTAELASDGVITAGEARVYALVSIIPGT